MSWVRGRQAGSVLVMALAAAAGAEEQPQALTQGNIIIDRVEHNDNSGIVTLGNLVATAPEEVALPLMERIAHDTDNVVLQDAAIEGLHNLSPEVRRAAIIAVAILDRGKGTHGSEIRRELLENDQPKIVRAAEDYAGYAHDDLAVPDLIRLLDQGKSAEAQEGAHLALSKIAGKDAGATSAEWSSWYQQRSQAIDDMIRTVRVDYGKKDKLAEIQAVRALFSVTDLPTMVLDALVDISHNDPEAEIRSTAALGVGQMQCVARYEYDAGTYSPTASFFEGGAPPESPALATVASVAATQPSSHWGWFALGGAVLLAGAAWMFRPRSQQPQSRPAAMLIRHQAARAPQPPGKASARPAPAAGQSAAKSSGKSSAQSGA